MAQAMYFAPQPERPAPIVLATLHTNMLKLAAEKTAGCHPYFVPPEHTACAPPDPRPRRLAVPRADGYAGKRPGQGAGGGAQADERLCATAQLPQ